jgi:acyl-CoA synthetase (AMP-forming)/AMP-acid ligase II
MVDATRFALRPVPADLAARYRAEGWWRDETLGDAVDRSLTARPDVRIGVWSRVRPWHGTYADVHHEARRLVTALRDAGIEPGSTVAFQLPNWREAVVAFYGLALGGYVLVPIVHIYGPSEVRFILAQSGARAYVSTDRFGPVDYLDIVDAAPPGSLPDLAVHLVVGDATAPPPPGVRRIDWSVVDASAPATPAVTGDPDDVCVLAYTSGTTSRPKGVIHTHRSLLAEVTHIRGMIAVAHPNLMGSPVTHATGMLGAVLAPMELGEPIHLIDRWDPDHVLEIMLEAGIGAGTGAAVFLASVIDHPGFTAEHASKVRRVGLGGAPVPVALGERAAAHGIVVMRAYGSTEHPSVTSGDFDDPAAKRHATDGRPLPGVEMRLLDEAGAPVGSGEPGEIWSRGPDLALGYTDPELTERAFTPDGWYRTGDLGVVDADGYLTITDRLNDVIIRGGENISAAEVEEAIATLPQVLEVAVVAEPDARLGEHACALVRTAPDTVLDLATVRGHLAEIGIAKQKWPESLRVVDDFPRTASGKIRKVDLRRQLREEAAP